MISRFAVTALVLAALAAPSRAQFKKREQVEYRRPGTIYKAGDVWKKRRTSLGSELKRKGIQAVSSPEPTPTPTPTATDGSRRPRRPTVPIPKGLPPGLPGSALPGTAASLPKGLNTTPAAPPPPPVQTAPLRKAADFVGLMRQNVRLLIQDTIGSPYAQATDAADPATGFSPGGYAHYLLKQLGYVVPADVTKMFRTAGFSIVPRHLAPGDLLFYKVRSSKTGRVRLHVGIYFGDNKFAYASLSQKKIVLSNVNKPFWLRRFVLARRVITDF